MDKETAVCKGTGFFMPLTFRTTALQRRSASLPAPRRQRKSRRQQRQVSQSASSDLTHGEKGTAQTEHHDEMETLGSAQGLSDDAACESIDHASLASPAPHLSSYGYTYAWQFIWTGQGGFWLPAVRAPAGPYMVPIPAVASCTLCPLGSYQQPYSHDQANTSTLDSKRGSLTTLPAAGTGASGVPMHPLSPPGLQC